MNKKQIKIFIGISKILLENKGDFMEKGRMLIFFSITLDQKQNVDRIEPE